MGFKKWESPISIIETEMRTEFENDILKAVVSTGIKVDKEELIKALKNDRNQYKKGYEDGIDDGRELGKRETYEEIMLWIRAYVPSSYDADFICGYLEQMME